MRRVGWLAGFLLILVSCSHRDEIAEVSEDAQYFRLTDTLGITIAEVYDPFSKGALQARYYLARDTSRTPEGVDTKQVIRIPVTRAATTSATHIGFLRELDALGTVVAMSNPEWVYNRPSQPVANIGEDINLDIERLMLSKPDVLFVSSYGQNSQQVERAVQAGIPVVYMSEWMEQHPLARAQWLQFAAAFFGKRAMADSILSAVRAEYNAARAQCQRTENEKRSIMSGASYRGTWYVPSGNTYMGCLLRDAGARYAFAGQQTEGSIPLNMEQALQAFADADVWIGANAHSLSELQQIDEKHAWFRAFRTGEVFHFYKQQNKQGGNDFWERGVVHPEIILQDLQWALYPARFPDYTPVFLERLTP